MTSCEPVKERITVIALLDWAYRRQLAHRHPQSESFGMGQNYQRDSCAKIETMRGVVGCHIDGGQWKEIGHRVHPDAEMVVSAVSKLPDFCRHLVHMHASAGTQPDWGEICRVWPERKSNGKIRVDSHDVTITNKFGRTSTVTVKFCPFVVFPNIDYCREEYRLWHHGLDMLALSLKGVLRIWEVVDIGISPHPWIKAA